MNYGLPNCQGWLFFPFIQVFNAAQSIQTGLGTSLCSLSRLSLPSRPHSLFLLDHSCTRTGISLCSQPRLSLPCSGLLLVRWQWADTGLLHPIRFLWILNLLWKFHGSLGPYRHRTCDTWHLTSDLWHVVEGEHSLKMSAL